MPAYNEEEGITKVVRNFLSFPCVAEVVVADNNSKDRTAEFATAAGARVVKETQQGYGYACRRALSEARSEWVCIVESDCTFDPRDVEKFVAYTKDFDVIFGTRTSKSCIWSGANMGHFLRFGNVAVAKLLEYLHNGPCLTDVGCTYKMVRRDVVQEMSKYWYVGDSRFSPELMMLCIRMGWRCIEIPVNYLSRTGESKITGSFKKAFVLGLRMIALIFRYRFRSIPKVAASSPVPAGLELLPQN